jgi:hypothetical protein
MSGFIKNQYPGLFMMLHGRAGFNIKIGLIG